MASVPDSVSFRKEQAMQGSLNDWLAHGTVFAFVMVFVSGVLTSLTPCVYPLIPITVGVFGARDENVGKLRAFTLGWMYVLGIVVMYTSLGVVVALTAHGIPHFGTWLANPWVVVPIALVFGALAASMFGAFELQLPYSLQQRLSTVGGRGFLGAFSMGLVGGILAAPCTGPVLAGLLTYVATHHENVVKGGSLLAVYALGMGMLFLVLATFSLKLPKSGRWMEVVKSVFGIVFIVAALYYLRGGFPALARLISSRKVAFAAGAGGAVVLGLLIGGAHLTFHEGVGHGVRKALGIALASGGAIALLGYLMTPKHPVAWRSDVEQALADATNEHKPALLDFGNEAFCAPCVLLQTKTFADDLVNAELDKFVAVKIEVGGDDDTPEGDAAADKFHADTLPTVVLLDPNGKVVWSLHSQQLEDASGNPTGKIDGEVISPDQMLAALRTAEAPAE
jgi:thiol:disulfide interchange protein DsbD